MSLKELTPTPKFGFVFVNTNERIHYKQLRLLLERTKLFTSKYPRLLSFFFVSIIAFYLIHDQFFSLFLANLGGFVFLGEFIGGALLSFGLTSPLAVAIFLKLNPANLFVAAVIGGVGALLSNIIIYKFVKISFDEEFAKLKQERPFLFLRENITSRINPTLLHYLSFVFVGVLFVSPLPDEAGIMLLTGLTRINLFTLAVVSFVCNVIGIFLLLLI